MNDDAAVLKIGNETLVTTHDMMAEGVHFLPDANPADVAWKLVAVNLSDLAAKGAEPIGVLLGFTLGDDAWDEAFARGLEAALSHFDVALLGGDTVSGNENGRILGLTALGRGASDKVPARSGAKSGDALYITGIIGDALAGYELITSQQSGPQSLLKAYNRPQPLISAGRSLAPVVTAMMDVSDGLLLDASRMAQASGLAVEIDLAALPLSENYKTVRGNGRISKLAAASWGDDYQLLFAASPDAKLSVDATRVGIFLDGSGITLHDRDEMIPLPEKLGFQHS